MDFVKSLWLLFLGILKRLYYLIPSLFSDPFEVLERWFNVRVESPQWLFWLLFSFGLVLAIILAYHELRMQKVALEKRLDDKSKRKAIRETLGGFLAECESLMERSVKENNPPEKDTEELTGRLQSYLHNELGDAYISRLNSNAGIVGLMGPVKHPKYWKMFYKWSVRLGEFIAEFKD